MKLGQKVFYVSTSILEIVLLIAAYMVNYFTKTRMGMARHVIHKNYTLESTYPIEILKYGLIIFFILIMIILLILYNKRKANLLEIVKKINIEMIVSILFFTIFVTIGSTESMRSFYYVSAILALLVFIQSIKTFIGIMWYKK